MTKVFNVAALVVRAYRASITAATAVLRNDGAVIPEAIREVHAAYQASSLPLEVKLLEKFLEDSGNNPPAWAEDVDKAIELFKK